jgi:hypothetical protein
MLDQNNEGKGTLGLTFVDFKKAFVSLATDVVMMMMMMMMTVRMMKSLYEGFKCCVVHAQELADSSKVTTAGRLGCVLAPTLFLLVLDNVMNKFIKGRNRGIQWRMMERSEDLDYAGDFVYLHKDGVIEKPNWRN